MFKSRLMTSSTSNTIRKLKKVWLIGSIKRANRFFFFFFFFLGCFISSQLRLGCPPFPFPSARINKYLLLWWGGSYRANIQFPIRCFLPCQPTQHPCKTIYIHNSTFADFSIKGKEKEKRKKKVKKKAAVEQIGCEKKMLHFLSIYHMSSLFCTTYLLYCPCMYIPTLGPGLFLFKVARVLFKRSFFEQKNCSKTNHGSINAQCTMHNARCTMHK